MALWHWLAAGGAAYYLIQSSKKASSPGVTTGAVAQQAVTNDLLQAAAVAEQYGQLQHMNVTSDYYDGKYRLVNVDTKQEMAAGATVAELKIAAGLSGWY